MKLKRIITMSILAILGWFGITQGTKIAQAYVSQQQTLSQIPLLLSEIGNPEQAPSLEALKKSQQRLKDAVAILEAIPALPGFAYDRAQSELTKARPLLEQVTARVQREEQAATDLATALKLDTEAAELAKNSPHPVDVWQQAQDKWRQAIALLEKIPPNSFVSIQAKAGLESCRKNFQYVGQQWMQESKALRDIETAISTAEQSIKTLRNGTYQPADLTTARNQWVRSLALLRQIPDSTTIFRDAQTLVMTYEMNLRKLDNAIAAKNCQSRDPFASPNFETSGLCESASSLDLESPMDVLTAQAEASGESFETGAEPVDSVDSAPIPAPLISTYSHRYQMRSRASSIGGTYVHGYTRSNGTYVQGHYRSSGSRASGFGSFRSGGASS